MQNFIANITDCIGNTPLLKLVNINLPNNCNLFLKLEFLNLGNNIKARTALSMIEEAEKKSFINPTINTLLEVTSGNQGISAAMIGAIKGYKVIIIMPENMSIERVKLIKAYGAEIILAPKGNNIKEAIDNCFTIANSLQEKDKNIYMLKQFENIDNPLAHRKTAQEIIKQMNNLSIDAVISGLGSGGCISGLSEEFKKQKLSTKFIVADPIKCSVLSNLPLTHHEQQGIGDGIIPPFLNKDLINKVILVKDDDAIKTAKILANKHGIFCGISSGTNVWAAMELAKEMPQGSNIVTFICDTGERYLSTKLFQ